MGVEFVYRAVMRHRSVLWLCHREELQNQAAQAIADDLDLSGLDTLATDATLAAFAADTVSEAIAKIGVDLPGDLVDQVNERAVAIAKERAAELVDAGHQPLTAAAEALPASCPRPA